MVRMLIRYHTYMNGKAIEMKLDDDVFTCKVDARWLALHIWKTSILINMCTVCRLCVYAHMKHNWFELNANKMKTITVIH